MRLVLLGTLLVLATFVHSLTVSLTCRHECTVTDVGITSLLPRRHKDSGPFELFAGTKRGMLQRFLYSSCENDISLLEELQDGEVDPKPFPIFSMTSNSRVSEKDEDVPFQLFCGGGDRYISVWQRGRGVDQWICSKRLGPHTGWVKDVLYNHNTGMLHSIGCNCIESWKQSDENKTKWAHAAKRSIESSLEEGATLSSDLLCLCASSDEVDRFYAGGVDGRLHAWSYSYDDTTGSDPLYSIAAHKGRVNVMGCSRMASLLFSSGHDGVVQCRRVLAGKPLRMIPDAQFQVLDKNGVPARVTALALLQESYENVYFVIGTADGVIICFEAFVKEGMVILKEMMDERFHFLGEPMINAIFSLEPTMTSKSSASWTLAVGHSLGLSMVTVERRP